MPGRYRFPRPSRRLRQTRLEPRERQQKLESHDLPVNRRPVVAGSAPGLSAASPLSCLHKGVPGLTRPCCGRAVLCRVMPFCTWSFCGAAGRGRGLVGILWGHPQAEVSHPAEPRPEGVITDRWPALSLLSFLRGGVAEVFAVLKPSNNSR